MAKKKGAGKKKQASGKNARGKLETKLFGYWKTGHWGEFVTLFQRQQTKAQQTTAARYWNPAVYNLLLQSIFARQDLELLENVLSQLQHAPDLSQENRDCLQVAETFLAACSGCAQPQMARELPENLPAPFQQLADKLQELLTANNSPLQDYLLGHRQKARRGEKHFSLAVQAKKQYDALARKNFQPETVQTLTMFKNTLRDMDKAFSANYGLQSSVLQDIHIAGQILHALFSRPVHFRNPSIFWNHMTSKGFQAVEHPVVHNMLRAILLLGRNILGQSWYIELRRKLSHFAPQLSFDLPEHLHHQLHLLQQLQTAKSSQNHHPLSAMLRQDLWSRQERTMLLLARMLALQNEQQDILLGLYESYTLNEELLISRDIKNYLDNANWTLHSTFDHLSALGLQDMSLFAMLIQEWQTCVAPFPFFHNLHSLDKIMQNMCSLPVPDAALLFPLLKRTEIENQASDTAGLLQIQKERAPLQVGPEDLRKAIKHITPQTKLNPVFQAWKKCLDARSYQLLVQIFLQQVFKATCREPENWLESFTEDWLDWTDIPLVLIQDFLQAVDQDFELSPLLRLTAAVPRNKNKLPVPRNEQEAGEFLSNPPPADTLLEILFWMLRWPVSDYFENFLAELIRRQAEHLSQNSSWRNLAQTIRDNKRQKLAGLVWTIWEELQLFQHLANNTDFLQAKQTLMPLLQKNKNTRKSKTGKKKKSLLQEVLEERKKK